MPISRSKIVIGKNLPVPRPPRPIMDGHVQYYFDDPSVQDLVTQAIIPSTPLPVSIQGYLGGGQPVGTMSWQAATSAITIGNALTYISSRSPKPIARWAATNALMVFVRAGQDLNAYYDRQALRFFFIMDPVIKQTIYACDGASVVAHELGHAILDILRPDFWNSQSLEVFAFHEAFGDCAAILEMMIHDEVLRYALNETGNDMLKTNVITRLAKQMGAAAYHLAPPQAGFNPNWLRNASNDFKYVLPESLPADTPDFQLSKEPHNFSRIWTGAWWEILARIHAKLVQAGNNPLTALHSARDTACDYLLQAVVQTPNTPRLFDALARQMLLADSQRNNQHQEILLNVFNNRNILLGRVAMLSEVDAASVASLPNANVVQHAAGKSVYVRTTKKLKMVDHSVSALANTKPNPLYSVHIEVPVESAYHFDQKGILVDRHEADEQEAIESARHCLDYLHSHQLVSSDPRTPFEIQDNSLVRSHACGGCPSCNQNNACDPNAPEYRKGFKANNNAGCGCKGCGHIPVCDCAPRPVNKVKLGCTTNVRVGNLARYQVGQHCSRTVC